jgi:hypothetical protein
MGPKCTSIQEQIEPTLPFSTSYILNGNGSYVKAEGAYLNGSVFTGSTVQLSCYYPGTFF